MQDPYKCDSVDLTETKARDYWLKCILDMLTTFQRQAACSCVCDPTADHRATEFYKDATARINELAKEDFPVFSIRGMFCVIQECLQTHQFVDPWREKKQLENERALQEFRSRLDDVDRIEDVDTKWTELIKGVLAGEQLTTGG